MRPDLILWACLLAAVIVGHDPGDENDSDAESYGQDIDGTFPARVIPFPKRERPFDWERD
jgi:hypothetical protein